MRLRERPPAGRRIDELPNRAGEPARRVWFGASKAPGARGHICLKGATVYRGRRISVRGSIGGNLQKPNPERLAASFTCEEFSIPTRPTTIAPVGRTRSRGPNHSIDPGLCEEVLDLAVGRGATCPMKLKVPFVRPN